MTGLFYDLNLALLFLDPHGREAHLDVSRVGDKYRYTFTPKMTGKYQVRRRFNLRLTAREWIGIVSLLGQI